MGIHDLFAPPPPRRGFGVGPWSLDQRTSRNFDVLRLNPWIT